MVAHTQPVVVHVPSPHGTPEAVDGQLLSHAAPPVWSKHVQIPEPRMPSEQVPRPLQVPLVVVEGQGVQEGPKKFGAHSRQKPLASLAKPKSQMHSPVPVGE